MRTLLTKSGDEMFSRFCTPVEKNSPSKVVGESRQETAGTTSVTARLEATKEGICPYCKHPMRKALAVNNMEVWLCDGDRHVAPVRTP